MVAEKRRVVERYFEALDRADFETAAAQFTPDVTYIHPPMYGDETHIHDREHLLRYFEETRGPTETDHHVDRSVAGETSCAVVGYVTETDDSEPLEWFVAYAEFDGDRIDYYIAGLLGLS